MIIKEVVQHSHYWKVKVSSDWDEMRSAAQWCTSTGCGKQISVSQFGFKTEDEITMFRLRWETEFENGGQN